MGLRVVVVLVGSFVGLVGLLLQSGLQVLGLNYAYTVLLDMQP